MQVLCKNDHVGGSLVWLVDGQENILLLDMETSSVKAVEIDWHPAKDEPEVVYAKDAQSDAFASGAEQVAYHTRGGAVASAVESLKKTIAEKNASGRQKVIETMVTSVKRFDFEMSNAIFALTELLKNEGTL